MYLKRFSLFTFKHTCALQLFTFIFQKVNAETPRRGRSPNALKVALTYPSKKMDRKRPASEPLPQPEVQDSDSEEDNFMSKRALNIKENKEMVSFPALVLQRLPDIDLCIVQVNHTVLICYF